MVKKIISCVFIGVILVYMILPSSAFSYDDVSTSEKVLAKANFRKLVKTEFVAEVKDNKNGTKQKGSLPWPCESRDLTSWFGPRTPPTAGASDYHEAIDISGSSEDPIYAVMDGTVTYADVRGGYGNSIILDHGEGLSTKYNHLNSIAVSEGQSVKQGDKIGGMGTTGISTGDHLDFQIEVGGVLEDPLSWLKDGQQYQGEND